MKRFARITSNFSLLLLALAQTGQPAPLAAASSWPGLRGPAYDGTVREARLFSGSESSGEPSLRLVWSSELGPGYSVVTVDGERVVTAFQSADEDVVAAFDPETGDEIWRYRIADGYEGHSGSHDGPIATPALAGGRIFGLGPRGQLFALDAETGSELWTVDLAEDLGAEAPYYGFGASPIVVGDKLVVPLGAGEGKSIGGFTLDTGELSWSVGDGVVEYNSPILATLGGRLQVVAADAKVLRGIDASSGEVLWSHEHGGDERAMGGATLVPIPAGENRLLVLHSQPESAMLEITLEAGSWQIRELWKSGAIKGTYVQPVYHDGYLYGMNGKIFTCVDAESGEVEWKSREPGDGFPTLVGDLLVIMTKPGVLRVAEASPKGYREVASLPLFETVSWSAPAYANGGIFLRSMTTLARVDPLTIQSAEADPSLVAEEQVESPTAAAQPSMNRPGRGFAAFVAEVEAIAGGDAKKARIDAFLAEASVPVIEESGEVHFLYRGEASDVGIVGDMIGFRREDPMLRIADTDLFYYSTRLEPDAAVHYGFLVDFGEPIPDPLHPNTGDGLFGEVSFLSMPARSVPDFSVPTATDRQGALEEVTWESSAFEGATRKAWVYLPAGYSGDSGARYPTLYVHDGTKALENGYFKNALDSSIGGSVVPLIAVFVVPADPENGGREFRDPKYLEMIRAELVPLVDERYATRDDALLRASAGVGSGADMSFRLAFSAPDLFRRIGSLWPILFSFEGEPPAAKDAPLIVYQKWGRYHLRSPHENFDSAEASRKFFQRLRELGHRPSGGEVPEGMGWSNFRGYVGEMLRVLFPAP